MTKQIGRSLTINDYAAHPFQLRLARWFASRGVSTSLVYCGSNSTPHGDLTEGADGLQIVSVDTGEDFEKYRLLPRLLDEVRYGIGSIRQHRASKSETVITSNVPLVSLSLIYLEARLSRRRWVLWLQDLQSGLAEATLGERSLVARVLRVLEDFLIRSADEVVVISEGFVDRVQQAGAAPENVHVVENWAPLDELPELDKDNSWSRTHDLANRFVFLYSGTLGRKHNPDMLLALADRYRDRDDVVVAVISEGSGADWLLEKQVLDERPNLLLLPFQDYSALPSVLASADVLVVLLEPSAGAFSVPSKVLTYLTSGRPLLASLPAANLSNELIVDRAEAGLASEADIDLFVQNADQLLESAELRGELGANGRAYAEHAFDMDRIGARFSEIVDVAGPIIERTVEQSQA